MTNNLEQVSEKDKALLQEMAKYLISYIDVAYAKKGYTFAILNIPETQPIFQRPITKERFCSKIFSKDLTEFRKSANWELDHRVFFDPRLTF